jgi:plasmid stability protein
MADKVQVNIKNVPPELLKAAQAKAKKEDRSLSQIVRELLRKWLQAPTK